MGPCAYRKGYLFHLQMKYVAPVHISGDLVSLSHLVHYIHVPRETDVLANCFS